MTRPVIILHGWSDTADSFGSLAQFLRERQFSVVDIWLGEYLSMNDEITLYDLGAAFQRALAANKISQERHAFDLVVHSTGGLVAREYLVQQCAGDATRTPVKHLCMLAPANFGSPLAKMGKSLVGRLVKGWDWDHFGQTGTRILDALELGSPYSWTLADQDLFDPKFPVFQPSNTMATVMVGTIGYDNALRASLHENGSDGTVRVATANLNARRFDLVFESTERPVLVERKRSFDEVAFAVFARNHTSIHEPTSADDGWATTLVCALATEPDSYAAHCTACSAVTAATFGAVPARKINRDWFHEYQHVVTRVHDQFGHPIPDYVLEFYQERGDADDDVFAKLHNEILEKITTNDRDHSYRTFFFDVTDLRAFIDSQGARVDMSLSAAHVSERILYRNPKAGVRVFGSKDRTFICPNAPVLVDMQLYRDSTDEVFALKKAFPNG